METLVRAVDVSMNRKRSRRGLASGRLFGSLRDSPLCYDACGHVGGIFERIYVAKLRRPISFSALLIPTVSDGDKTPGIPDRHGDGYSEWADGAMRMTFPSMVTEITAWG